MDTPCLGWLQLLTCITARAISTSSTAWRWLRSLTPTADLAASLVRGDSAGADDAALLISLQVLTRSACRQAHCKLCCRQSGNSKVAAKLLQLMCVISTGAFHKLLSLRRQLRELCSTATSWQQPSSSSPHTCKGCCRQLWVHLGTHSLQGSHQLALALLQSIDVCLMPLVHPCELCTGGVSICAGTLLCERHLADAGIEPHGQSPAQQRTATQCGQHPGKSTAV